MADVLRRYRKKQEQCLHPSFTCSLCSLYKDNINSEQSKRIRELEASNFSLQAKLDLYENN